MKHTLDITDILSLEDYEKIRPEKRRSLIELKKNRRLSVGPYATLYFENFDTMWYQVQEMLLIEKGGDEQLYDELKAYQPLIPQGQDLRVTVMFEIEDQNRRAKLLHQWAGIEETLTLRFGDEIIPAIPLEDGQERTTEEGKTSSVHFIKFEFSKDQVKKFLSYTGDTLVGFSHENYNHLAAIPEKMRLELIKDFL